MPRAPRPPPPPRGPGPRKHPFNVEGASGDFDPSSWLTELTSYLTSHAYGTGSIVPSERFTTKQESRSLGGPALIPAAGPSAPLPAGKSFTPAGVASTLSFKGASVRPASGPTAADTFSSLVGSNTASSATLAAAAKSSVLELSPEDVKEIISRAEFLWRALAEKRLEGRALQEYLRAMRVEWKNDALVLKLEGWESASRELGWAPTPGGLDAGLGKYDGSLRDLRPILLGGRQSRVIPMKLEGAVEDLRSKMQSEIVQFGTRTKSYDDKMSGLVDQGMVDAFKAKPGEAVRLGRGKRSSSSARRLGHSDPHMGKRGIVHGASRDFGKNDLDNDDVFDSKRLSLRTRMGLVDHADKKVNVYYTKSIFEGAVRARNKLRAAKVAHMGEDESTSNLGAPFSRKFQHSFVTRDSDGTFIVFRTISNGQKKRSKRGGSDYNDAFKWHTAGRSPNNLMEAVLSTMRNFIANIMTKKTNNFIKDQMKSAVTGSAAFKSSVSGNKLINQNATMAAHYAGLASSAESSGDKESASEYRSQSELYQSVADDLSEALATIMTKSLSSRLSGKSRGR